jgi:hypothetical protein
MLQDKDMQVVGSAVNVICELSLKNPKDYVTLAPTLFDLLTRPKIDQPNNWMLIKIVKLVCSKGVILVFILLSCRASFDKEAIRSPVSTP